MNKSESIAEIAKALSKAQGMMKPAPKDSLNPHFKSKYADLASVVEAIREPFSNNGLSYSQLCDFTETGGLIIETVLMHESGEWYSGRLFMPCSQQTPQGVGSAITYAKRYSLAAIAGLATDDDDGNDATGLTGGQIGKNKPPAKTTEKTLPPAEPPAKASAAQIDRIKSKLLDWCLGEAEQAKVALLKVTGNKVSWADLETISQKWAGAVIGKIDEAMKGEQQ